MRTEHHDELLARAAFVAARLPPDVSLIGSWQGIADRFGYPGAEALATIAFERLAEASDNAAALALAREFLSVPLGRSVLATIKDRRRAAVERFESATGFDWAAFQGDLFDYLRGVEQSGSELLERIPPLAPVALSTSSDGVPIIEAGFEAAGPTSDSTLDPRRDMRLPDEVVCYLRHNTLTPFAGEWDVDDEDEQLAPCTADPALFELRGLYAPGDRAYLAFGFESDDFHQPFRLGAIRLDVQ